MLGLPIDLRTVQGAVDAFVAEQYTLHNLEVAIRIIIVCYRAP